MNSSRPFSLRTIAVLFAHGQAIVHPGLDQFTIVHWTCGMTGTHRGIGTSDSGLNCPSSAKAAQPDRTAPPHTFLRGVLSSRLDGIAELATKPPEVSILLVRPAPDVLLMCGHDSWGAMRVVGATDSRRTYTGE